MCDYCENETIILNKDFVSMQLVGWNKDMLATELFDEAYQDTLSLFIDRCYLRFVDYDDSGCLDHGWKIEIKFCPFCGMKLFSE